MASASEPGAEECRTVQLGVIEFHSPRLNPGLIERFYAVVEDLRASGSIVDLWLMDIATVLREFGYEMTIVSTAKPAASSVASASPPAEETPANPGEIVGHKTFSTGQTGPDGFPVLRHEPLTRAEADAVLADSDRQKAERAEAMPTETHAREAMFSAWLRLKELGWKEAIYCPKDGTPFDAIEVGSTGVHECSYHGEWPTGGWWTHADGDLWPSRPVLFRLRSASPSAGAAPADGDRP